MGQYGTWTDGAGMVHPVPPPKRLKFKVHSHAALRAYVMGRDGYRCQNCGAAAYPLPHHYDGRRVLLSSRLRNQLYFKHVLRFLGTSGDTHIPVDYEPLMLDHVQSLRNGGTNHPSNLQVLCGYCNSAKACLVDARWGRGAP